jgi:hypothetical protein
MAKKQTQEAINIAAAGWGKSPASRKWHYFSAEETTALCGGIGFYFGEREAGNDAYPGNCAACKKKLMAHLKRTRKED